MVIRDRLLALIFRCLILVLGIATLYVLVSYNAINGIWDSFGNYATIITVMGCLVVLSEIIANAIGMKERRNTLAPGIIPMLFHSVLALEVALAVAHPVYCHFISGAYINAETTIYVSLSYLAFPAAIALDWLLFGEKGTVRWSSGVFPLLVPVFYYLFSLMKHLLLTSSSYRLSIFDPNTFLMSSTLGSQFKAFDGWAGVMIACFTLLGVIAAVDFLIILMNNLLAHRYSGKSGY